MPLHNYGHIQWYEMALPVTLEISVINAKLHTMGIVIQFKAQGRANQGKTKNPERSRKVSKVLRFPVVYRYSAKVLNPGDPGWTGTYSPPAIYGAEPPSES